MLAPSDLSLDFNAWLAHMDLSHTAACTELGIVKATLNRLIAKKRTEGAQVYPVYPSLTLRLLMTFLQERKATVLEIAS